MPRVLIAGCGFLGEAAAGLFLTRGWEVLGLTRSGGDSSGHFALETGDLADRASVEAVRQRAGDFNVVVHCASSGRGGEEAYRQVYLCGVRHLAASFAGARLIFTGSTSVYAQTDGEWVDETGPTEPPRATGQILLEAERAVLLAGGVVARLAGIYGPGRSVLLRKFLDGSAVLEAGGGRWINQIHRDDAAAAVVRLADAAVPSGIYNVVDDTPASQREVYGWLATEFSRPLPPEGPADLNRKRGWTSKRVSNAKLRAVGWRATYPSFRDALTTLE